MCLEYRTFSLAGTRASDGSKGISIFQNLSKDFVSFLRREGVSFHSYSRLHFFRSEFLPGSDDEANK